MEILKSLKIECTQNITVCEAIIQKSSFELRAIQTGSSSQTPLWRVRITLV